MYRVLLIEDEDIIRQGIRQAIPWEECGCTVVGEGRNGIEGQAAIQSLQPDIVIVDLNMPIMGGLEMLETTKSSHPYLAIVLTGYAEFSMAQTAIHLGVFEYLLKPLNSDQMVTTLHRAVQRLGTSGKQERKVDSPLSQLVNQTPDDPIVQAVLQYFEVHYAEKITITNLTATLHYSDRYISQKFQKAFGTTVIDYLTRYRLHRALQLMEEGAVSISDIGYACGMGEYKYFSQVFKKYLDCSPKKYRQQKK